MPLTEEAGRDKGKIFVVKEAPAAQAERWATRALLLLARSGVDMPDNVEGTGWAGIAFMGYQALTKINYDEVQPLLDEMWSCVSIRPDPKHPEVVRSLFWGGPDGEGADLEEISTMMLLRKEVFELHSGFSIPGVRSTSENSTTSSTPGEPSSTQTLSRSTVPPSPRRSRVGRQPSRT